jgi:hypothetical protein
MECKYPVVAGFLSIHPGNHLGGAHHRQSGMRAERLKDARVLIWVSFAGPDRVKAQERYLYKYPARYLYGPLQLLNYMLST